MCSVTQDKMAFCAEVYVEGRRKLPTPAGSAYAGLSGALISRIVGSAGKLLLCWAPGKMCLWLLPQQAPLRVFMWKFSSTRLPLLVENSYSFFCVNQKLKVWAGFESLV